MSARLRAVVIALALAATAGGYLALRLVVDADFAAFLPRGANERQQWLVGQLRDGPAARLIIAGIDGSTPDGRVETSRAVAEALAARPEFAYVNNGSVDVARKDLEALSKHRYALSPAMSAEKFSEAGLREALERGLASLQGSFAVLDKLFLFRDPTGETLGLLQGMARDLRIRRDQGVWTDASGDRALLLLQTTASGSDLEGQSAAIGALERAFAAVSKPGQTLVASSPGMLAVASRAVVERDARRISWMSAIGVLAVLLVAYRSIPVVAICFVPAALGLLAGVTAVQAAFGSVHAITFAFGATLLGEAVDYPSYLLTSGAASPSADGPRHAVARSMGLAVATTACGSFALLMSGFEGLMQLGLLTAVGIVAAGAATWWLVPSLVPSGWSFRPLRIASPKAGWRVPMGVTIGLFATATIASIAWFSAHHVWDDDPARMNPLPASMAAQDRSLREAIGAPDARYFALVRGTTLQAALERSEALRARLAEAVERRTLGGYTLVSDVLPSEATQRRRLAMLPDRETLRARLAVAQRGLPFRPDAFASFVDEAGAAASAPMVGPESFAGTGIGVRLQSLIAKVGTDAVVIVPLSGVTDAEALRRSLAGDGVEIVDLRQEVGDLLGAFRERAMIAVGIGLALIYAILAIGLRSPMRAARIVAPPMLAALWTLAAIAASGHALTLFHVIAALLVVGVGVNYMLFAFPVEDSRLSRTAWASLVVVSATTLVAFGSMATSAIPVLNALGVTVTAGVVATLIACALLAGSVRSRA